MLIHSAGSEPRSVFSPIAAVTCAFVDSEVALCDLIGAMHCRLQQGNSEFCSWVSLPVWFLIAVSETASPFLS